MTHNSLMAIFTVEKVQRSETFLGEHLVVYKDKSS